MTKLKADTILQRAREIGIRIDSAETVEISLNRSNIICSNHCLPILEVFAHPVSLQEGVRKLHATGALDWMQLTGTIRRLYKFGALRNALEAEPVPAKEFWNFGAAPVHISMLNDRTRTQTFIETIRETVRAGDVVVDIGTGTGVLAIAAARAGASKVFAVEVGAMAETARKIIDKTEVAEKIEIIHGWSPQITLPEKADVLVSEIIGNDPFAENVLQIFKDARRRLLKPSARIVPNRLKMFGLPVEISESFLQNNVLTAENIENWKNWYNVDFSHLQDNVNYKTRPLLEIKTRDEQNLNILGEPFLLADVDFYAFKNLSIRQTAVSKLSKAGILNGLLIYFELVLGSRTISTHPEKAGLDNHWLNPIWHLSGGKSLPADDSFTVQFHYDEKQNNSEVVLLDDVAAAQK